MPNLEIFNLLHDGVIVDAKGTIPGDLTLVVECNYLRKRIADPGENFHIRISQCTSIRYEPNEPGQSVLRDIEKIATLGCEILSAELIDGQIVVYTGPGQLLIDCGHISIATNEQTPFRVADLEEVAKSYWTSWQNGALAGRLMFICERLLAGKDSVSESMKQISERKLDKLDDDVEESIVKTRDVFLRLASQPPDVSMTDLKVMMEKLKAKYPDNAPEYSTKQQT